MTPLQQRILDHLFDTGRAQSLSAVTVALKEPQGDVYTALNTLRIQGAVVLNGYSKYRLENATKTRMGEEAKRLQHERGEKRSDDLPDPPGAPPMVPRDGLPEPAIGDLQTTLETTQVTGMSEESGDLQPDQASAEWDCTIADGLDLDEQTPAATTATDQIAADRSPAPELATDGDTTDCSDKLTAERSGSQPAPGDTEVSAAGGGIVGLAIMPQLPERCDRCRCWTREPDTVFGWCFHNGRMMQPEHGTCGRFQSIEPTDAELDAIEAEEEQVQIEGNADREELDEPKGREQVEDCESRRNQSTCGDCRNLEGRYFESGHQRGTCMTLPRRGDGLRHQRWAKQWVRNAGIGAGESCEFFVSRFGPKRIEEELDEQPYFETSQQLYEAVEQASIGTENGGDCRENEPECAKGPPDTEHVWGPARDRPTKGLRIEQLVKEFVALEARRKKLLEELGRLVG